MKYFVVQSSNGNVSIVSEWDTPDQAKNAYWNQCRVLNSAPDVYEGYITIMDNHLNKFGGKYEEYISHPVIKYTVEFNTDGGSEIAIQEVEKGSKVIRPSDPVKEGYTFVKWTFGTDDYDFNTAVNSDLILTAVWEAAA